MLASLVLSVPNSQRDHEDTSVTELTPCWAKLVRTRTLMRELIDLQAKRETEEPYSFELVDNNEDSADRWIRLQWRVKINTPYPPDAAWILGDIVHNLRSSLDNALFHIVTEINGHTPSDSEARQIQYPIDDTPELFRRHIKKLGKWLTPEQCELIEATQPFAASGEPNDEFRMMSILRDLSNTDKHRQLIVADRALVRANFEHDADHLEALTITQHDARMVDGAAVLTVKFRRPYDNLDIMLQPRFENTTFIFHPAHTPLPLALSLELIYDEVFDAVLGLTKEHMTTHDDYIAVKFIEGAEERRAVLRKTL